jgi:predicted transcriptional regulator
MPTRQELILQFMLQIAANGSVQVTDAKYVHNIACNLADQYIKNQA